MDLHELKQALNTLLPSYELLEFLVNFTQPNNSWGKFLLVAISKSLSGSFTLYLILTNNRACLVAVVTSMGTSS